MNAFVAGNVNEVQELGKFLLDAAEAVDNSINGTDIHIQYKDGEISISYKPVATIE